MINAAIVGLGRWGRTLVEAVQGKSEKLHFTTAVSRDPNRVAEFAGANRLRAVGSLDAALASVERLRVLALAIRVPCGEDGAPLRVTFSAGLATTAEGARSLDEIVGRADAALYEAKNEGRDLVRIDRESYQTASTGVRRALHLR